MHGKTFAHLALRAILPLAFQCPGVAETQWSLSAPDASCGITLCLSSDGSLTYQISRRNRVVTKDAPLGLVIGDEDFTTALRPGHAGAPTSRRERYELFAGIAPKVDRLINHRSIRFQNSRQAEIIIDLAASDQGVAYRYRFDRPSAAPIEVMEERSGFRVPADARGWMQPYHAGGKYTPAYEDFYFPTAPGDSPPHSREKPLGWGFPALFHLPTADTWLLLTEVSSEDPYPGCHLAADSSDGVYRIAFPRQNELRGDASGPDSPARPRHMLPWTMPWRVVIVAGNAADIATSTLVTDLAPPSRIADPSWIKPGRASWAWWSNPEGPFTEAAFNEFTDMASEMGWEYTLFDANWWNPGLAPLIRHASSKNISSMFWTHARDFSSERKRQEKLNEIAGHGAVGFKADFWCSDRQETMETISSLIQDAAGRKLLVNLHGCTLPRGWHRTWPNFMTAEAVLGAESYLYESHYTEKAAELNTVLPFTRNVAGPMDYTPVALSGKRYPRITTAAHELATAIVFTSGIIHYAEGPSTLGKLPDEARRILRDAPARWDETRCLIGEPGQLVVFARRSGASWFIAGLNGTSGPRSATLDLAPFRHLPRRLLIGEAEDERAGVSATSVAAEDRWEHTLPPRGGFILRLDP